MHSHTAAGPPLSYHSLCLFLPLPPPLERSASVCGWKGQGPAAVRSNKSCRPVNHMCQQGHFYLWYVAIDATLPDEICMPLKDQAIHHSADLTTNANTHLGKQGLKLPQANRQTVWACHDDAVSQPDLLHEAWHILQMCWWSMWKWHQASKPTDTELLKWVRKKKKKHNNNLRDVASLVTSLQETADKLREEISVLFQQRFFQLLTHRAAGSRGQAILQGFTSTAFTKLWEHIGFND